MLLCVAAGVSIHSRKLDGSMRDGDPPRVLLIFPPFWEASGPYLSLPVIAQSLLRRGYVVRSFDLNLELMRWYSSPKGSRATALALGQLAHSPRLDGRLSLAAEWGRAWGPLLGQDHHWLLRAFARPGAQPLRASYRARAQLARLVEIIAFVTKAAGRDPRIPLPHADFVVECLRKWLRWRPEVIGFSAPSQTQLVAASDLSGLLRRLGFKGGIAVGGPAVTIACGRAVGQASILPNIDCCVIGQGESALAELVIMQREGKSWPRILRAGSGALGTSAMPAYDSMPLGKYYGAKTEPLLYPFSDGCPWRRCRYCNLPLIRAYRARPARQVIHQLRDIGRRLGYRSFANTGSAIAPARAEQLARAMRRTQVNVRWSSMARPEAGWTAKRCRVCRDGGLQTLHFGMESLSDRVLGKMNRGITAAEQEAALRTACEAGLNPLVFLMLDFPGEEPSDFALTLGQIEHYLSQISAIEITRFQLLYGAPIARRPELFNLSPVIRAQSVLQSSSLEIPIARSAADRRRLRTKEALLDRWIYDLNHRCSFIFYRTPVKTSIVLDGRWNGDRRLPGDLIRSGYFRLDAVLARRYSIDEARLRRTKTKAGLGGYVVRDQVRFLPDSDEKATVLDRLAKGQTVGEALTACLPRRRTRWKDFNSAVQFINTMDLLCAIVAR